MKEATQPLRKDSVAPGVPGYDVARIRADFPILGRAIYNRPLVYLDNAASAQKPRAVIDAMRDCMEHDYANVHRGIHYLSAHLTETYEEVRAKVARFINAPAPETIVYTHNATEAFNLVASSYGRAFLKEGDEVVITHMEHHANIVPWQILRTEKGIVLKVVPVGDDGSFSIEAFRNLLGPKTALVAVTHASNVLGTVTPAKEIARIAHEHGVPVLFDGSQAAVHMPVDVQDIDADFYIFTGHKLYGPTGIGILYAKTELLERMPPYQGGGDMISSVSFEKTVFRDPPQRFEAGTPPILEVVGLGAAVDYVSAIGMEAIHAHEQSLLEHATEALSRIDGLRLIGTAPGKAAIVSFTLDGIHPHDIGTIIDREGIAVRVGQHCAEPLMERFGVGATVRASFGLYNTHDEVEALVRSVRTVQEFFG